MKCHHLTSSIPDVWIRCLSITQPCLIFYSRLQAAFPRVQLQLLLGPQTYFLHRGTEQDCDYIQDKCHRRLALFLLSQALSGLHPTAGCPGAAGVPVWCWGWASVHTQFRTSQHWGESHSCSHVCEPRQKCTLFSIPVVGALKNLSMSLMTCCKLYQSGRQHVQSLSMQPIFNMPEKNLVVLKKTETDRAWYCNQYGLKWDQHCNPCDYPVRKMWQIFSPISSRETPWQSSEIHVNHCVTLN